MGSLSESPQTKRCIVSNGLNAISPKITCPLCRNIFSRTRLYEKLDELDDRPALWISGPPGSGKTALVCGYLNQRGKTTIWYQIDAEDDDPATFFYYLARATEQGTGIPPQVPPFTAEYFENPLSFTRWYFTRLCTSLSGPVVFVLDNFQELQGDSVVQTIVETIIANISPGIQLIIISRNQFPSSLTREKLNGRIATLGWDKLRLTLAESKGILTMRSNVSSETVELLHEKAAGWVAGLLLLEAGMKIVKTSDLRVTDGAKEELFHYFAGEIFDRLNAKNRNFLLRTSLLPHMTVSMACELSGVDNGAEILLALTRRNYFVTSRPTRENIYQYHPMFRDFLLLQLQRQLPIEEQKELAEKAVYCFCALTTPRRQRSFLSRPRAGPDWSIWCWPMPPFFALRAVFACSWTGLPGFQKKSSQPPLGCSTGSAPAKPFSIPCTACRFLSRHTSSSREKKR